MPRFNCPIKMFLHITLLLAGTLAHGQPPTSWQYTNTGENHTIVIPADINPIINGLPMDTGAYIGVFFDTGDSLKCAGYVEWRGISTSLAAWGNDGSSPPMGFAHGQEFKFKAWLPDSCTVENLKVTYSTDSLFTNTGAYANNGISGFASLEGNGCTGPIGINDRIWLKEISIYPNPFNEVFQLEFNTLKSGIAEVNLINMQGIVVYSGKQEVRFGHNSLLIEPVIRLPNGQYFLELRTDRLPVYLKVFSTGN